MTIHKNQFSPHPVGSVDKLRSSRLVAGTSTHSHFSEERFLTFITLATGLLTFFFNVYKIQLENKMENIQPVYLDFF